MDRELKRLKESEPWQWGEGAGATLLRLLTAEGVAPRDREMAAHFAGDPVVINDELAGILARIAQDGTQPEGLRAAAAIALGPVLDLTYWDSPDGGEAAGAIDRNDDAGECGLDRPAISAATFGQLRESLRRLHDDAKVPGLVRRSALEAAVRAPEEWQRDAVRDALASDDREWKLTGMFCATFVEGFEPEILEGLESRDPDTLLWAVNAAGAWEVDAAWPMVTSIVRRKRVDRDLLATAIRAVGVIRPAQAADVLRDLADSDDDEIREAVLEALGQDDDDAEGDGDLEEAEESFEADGEAFDSGKEAGAGSPRAGSGLRLVPPPGPKVGRNETCPCGSGKKYKKCCGK